MVSSTWKCIIHLHVYRVSRTLLLLFPHTHIKTKDAAWNQTCMTDTYFGLWRAPTCQLSERMEFKKWSCFICLFFLFCCSVSPDGGPVFSPCTALLSPAYLPTFLYLYKKRSWGECAVLCFGVLQEPWTWLLKQKN